MKSAMMIVSAALLATTPVLAQNATPPRQFVRQAIQGDNSEIMLGNLAVQRGASRGTRQFGRTLVQDHQMAAQQMTNVANRLGMRAPTTTTREAENERRRLSRLSGRRFDREFANFMVNDHQKDIQNFADQARANNNGPVSRMAARQLPTLRKHLRIARSLQI